PGSPARGSGQSHVSSVAAARLPGAHVATLVQLGAGGRRAPAEVLAQIAATTDGIPLFVEELTKALIESGALRETSDGYALSAPLSAIEVPATIQDSLRARLDRLSSAKALAQLAAVLRPGFPHAVVAALVPSGPSVRPAGLP